MFSYVPRWGLGAGVAVGPEPDVDRACWIAVTTVSATSMATVLHHRGIGVYVAPGRPSTVVLSVRNGE